MTLHEFWLLIVKRWKLVVITPVICAIACLGFVLLHSADGNGAVTAVSRVVVNSQVQGVAGLAASEGRQYIADLYGEELPADAMTITAKGSADALTVTITVVGSDEADCLLAANKVAEAALSDAEESFSTIEELPFAGMVEDATITPPADAGSAVPKYLIVAVLVGLFIAICIAVLFDARRKLIKTPENAQEAVDLPILEAMPAATGERLLANVRFSAGKDEIESLYIVPSDDLLVAQAAEDLLVGAIAADGASTPSVAVGAPLSGTMKSAYEARKSDAVVVTVRQWVDTLPQLESTVAELRLANANLVGLVYAKEKLS